MDFKDIFHQLRVKNDFNQVDIAKKLNVSRSTISMWESGERVPPYERLEEIADFFNVDMDYLMGRTNKTTRFSDFAISSEELDLLIEINKLNHDSKDRLMHYIKLLLSAQDNLNSEKNEDKE